MLTAYIHIHMLDIRNEAVAILQAVLAGEGKYATHTLIELLKGEVQPSSQSHSLAGMGLLAGVYPDRILNLINYLLKLGFLGYRKEDTQKLQLEETGRKFLAYPSELPVSSQALRISPYENMLFNRLLAWRQKICETEALPPFRVLTTYAIQRVVQDRPENMTQLEEIPGLGPYKVKKYGSQILEIVNSINQIQLTA